MADENYDGLASIPFDQYGRYMHVKNIADSMREGRKQIKVLDVGGGGEQVLKRFLPHDEITVLDKDHQVFEGFVQGDALNMPFDDKTFDIVICSDMLEHIKEIDRTILLEEILRVSKAVCILAAPFSSENNSMKEAEIVSFLEGFEITDRWLAEHKRYRLPDEKKIEAWLKKRSCSYIKIKNNSHRFWSDMIQSYFIFKRADALAEYEKLSRYYNTKIAPYDHEEDSYRTIYVFSKEYNRKAISSMKLEQKDLSPFMLELKKMLYDLTLSHFLRSQKGIITDSQLKVMDENKTLKDALEERQERIEKLASENIDYMETLNELYRSKAWKLISHYRAGLHRLKDMIRYQPESKVSEIKESFQKTKRLVMIFPIIDWDFRIQRPQQLARLIAEDSTVVYFSTSTMRLVHDVSRERDISHIARLPIKKLGDNIFSVELLSYDRINIYKSPPSDRDVTLMQRTIHTLIAGIGAKDVISIIDLPFWHRIVKGIGRNKVIYDCMDEHSGFTGTSREMLKDEDRLIRDANLVISSSEKLYSRNKVFNENCILLKNGVDLAHFTSKTKRTDLAGYTRPILGYYGAISDWFDTALILELSRHFKDGSIVLIGSTAGCHELDIIRCLKNVHLLGEKDYSLIPSYLEAFDVALIPFKINSLTEATNPVKFYEYISRGKPVVSTDLPELRCHKGMVYLSKDHSDFIRNVRKALKDRSKRKRITFAKTQTWRHRYEELRKWL